MKGIVVSNCIRQLNIKNTNKKTNACAAAIVSKSDNKTTRKSYTTPPKPERPLRLFLRLPTDHPARQASPYAVLQKLRNNLGPMATDTIKETQHVPQGSPLGLKMSKVQRSFLTKSMIYNRLSKALTLS